MLFLLWMKTDTNTFLLFLGHSIHWYGNAWRWNTF